jgi:hypothetical protein
LNSNIPITNLPLLPFADLPSNSTCNLFGWGYPIRGPPRTEVISIYGPSFCDSNFPQTSCSTFNETNNQTCTAVIGSPVLCGSEGRFTGFQVSQGCVQGQNQQTMTFHSVNTFRTWIEEVLRSSRQTFNVATANVVEFFPNDIILTPRTRCAGTFISERHVVTIATCVILPENANVEIGVETSWINVGQSTRKFTTFTSRHFCEIYFYFYSWSRRNFHSSEFYSKSTQIFKHRRHSSENKILKILKILLKFFT